VGTSEDPELEARQAIIAAAFMLIAALLGAFVIDGANGVFELAESVIDKAEQK
jgi:hypothetical protein